MHEMFMHSAQIVAQNDNRGLKANGEASYTSINQITLFQAATLVFPNKIIDGQFSFEGKSRGNEQDLERNKGKEGQAGYSTPQPY